MCEKRERRPVFPIYLSARFSFWDIGPRSNFESGVGLGFLSLEVRG